VEPVEANIRVQPDPRSAYSQADIEENYATLIALQGLRENAVRAVERIVKARDQVTTIKSLAESDELADEDDVYSELTKRADDIVAALNDLEKLIRVPPETKGFVYDEDKLTSRIGLAQFYVGSARDTPTPAARTYIEIAEQESKRILTMVDNYFAAELLGFRDAATTAGIGLLSDIDTAAD